MCHGFVTSWLFKCLLHEVMDLVLLSRLVREIDSGLRGLGHWLWNWLGRLVLSWRAKILHFFDFCLSLKDLGVDFTRILALLSTTHLGTLTLNGHGSGSPRNLRHGLLLLIGRCGSLASRN